MGTLVAIGQWSQLIAMTPRAVLCLPGDAKDQHLHGWPLGWRLMVDGFEKPWLVDAQMLKDQWSIMFYSPLMLVEY